VTSVVLVTPPGPTTSTLTQQLQLQYCRWHKRFAAVTKHMQMCIYEIAAEMYAIILYVPDYVTLILDTQARHTLLLLLLLLLVLVLFNLIAFLELLQTGAGPM